MSVRGVAGEGVTSAAPLAAGRAQGFALLLLTTLCWGLNWPLMKYLIGVAPPLMIRTISGLCGAAGAFVVAAVIGERIRPPAGQWRPLCTSALLNVSAFMVASTYGLHWLDASDAVIIAYLLPLWTVIIAWPLLGERPTGRRVVGLLAGLAGVGVLVGAQPLAVSQAELPGVLLVLAGGWLFALGTVLAKRRPLTMPPVAAVGWQIGLGSLPFMLAAPFAATDMTRTPLVAWVLIIYLGLIPMFVAYLAWFAALRRLAASTAAIGTLIVPVVGVAGAALLLGEPLGPRQLGGLGLTLAGIALAVTVGHTGGGAKA